MRDGDTVTGTQTLEIPPLHGTLESLPNTVLKSECVGDQERLQDVLTTSLSRRRTAREQNEWPTEWFLPEYTRTRHRSSRHATLTNRYMGIWCYWELLDNAFGSNACVLEVAKHLLGHILW